MNLSSIWSTVYPIIIAILFFEFIVIIHEGGHFVAAKLMKIKVNEFAIGMGPKILSFKGKETRYSLRLFPIGGFCAMEGEDEASDSEGSFSSKRVGARAFVVVAGAIMNLLLGFVIYVATTTKDIARLAGVNECTLFRKFQNKKEIVLQGSGTGKLPEIGRAH